MQQSLNVIAGMLSNGRSNAFNLAWGDLRYQHTVAVRAKLAGEYKPATANKMLCALRRVMKEAWRLGQVSAEDYRRAVDLPSIRAHTLPRGRALAGGEIGNLLDSCAVDKSPAGTRDTALLAVLYGAGLRRSELVKLNLADYEPLTRALTIRGGKGGKDRVTYLGEDAGQALSDWMVVRGDDPGALFMPVNKAGRIMPRRMTDQAVLVILQKRAREAGVKAFSPHDLRRTFISDLLDAGADIATVQKLAGHASVTTTARYDRRGEEAKQKAADLLRLPRSKKTETAVDEQIL